MASNSDIEFHEGCWRFVTVDNLREQMSEDEINRAGLSDMDGTILMAKIQWSRQACHLMHGHWPFHGAPYHRPVSPQEWELASPDSDNDSDVTVLYGLETEEETSLITSTWTTDDSLGPEEAGSERRPGDDAGELVLRPAGSEGTEEEAEEELIDGFSLN